MKAMVLKNIGSLAESNHPLELVNLPTPVPAAGEIVINVSTCGVCHTEIDEIEGRTPPSLMPIILGRQIVGRVVQNGCS